ncbi:MAG: preprotein translocase subunit YajC [Gammaproteobacteria bacterium]|jgi:preprotein translocase subunit YajC|nr:preprotein translocase subunit YajC [Gammaproteobacteria bacterium]MDP6974822.1 preprotein translocase subunit YajC [Gammaproteobacteria bacterium]
MNIPPEFFLIAMFVLMYFLLIRPQQKRAKEHKKLLKELKKGDEVVTNGGVIGKVTSVDESFATIEISDGVIVKVQKQGINQKMPKGSVKQ